MKKAISFFMTLVLILSLIGGAAAAAPKTPVIKLNGKSIVFPDVKPYTTTKSVFVPLRLVATSMESTVTSKSTGDIEVVRGKIKLYFRPSSKSVMVNGVAYQMAESVVVKDKKTMVPAKFLVEKLGGTYKWDSKSNTVTITIKALPITQENSSVIPKAKTEFKPYIPKINVPVGSSVLNQLKKYEDNKGTNWPDDSSYEKNDDLIKRVGMDQVKEFAQLATGYVQTLYNVDYRSIDENYVKQLQYFFMPGTFGGKVESFVKTHAENIIKYKVIAKCEFLTDTSLVYSSRDGEYRIRGRIEITFSSADPKFFEQEQGMKEFKLGNWYYIDTEIGIGQLFGQGKDSWEHSKYCYRCSVDLMDNYVSLGLLHRAGREAEFKGVVEVR